MSAGLDLLLEAVIRARDARRAALKVSRGKRSEASYHDRERQRYLREAADAYSVAQDRAREITELEAAIATLERREATLG